MNLPERLWAPWRMAYVQQTEKLEPGEPLLRFLDGAEPNCFICQAVADSDDRRRLVVGRGEKTIAILNRFPYNNGHLLVAPQQHVARLGDLTPEVHVELMQEIARWIGVMERVLCAQGFNVGLNLGQIAGAGLPGHLHWHIVPRWSGDTNFMPALASVKIIPQALEALWDLLAASEAEDEASP